MDSIDRQLLALLQADAHLTFEELGKAVGLSTAATYQRVQKLETAKVLLGYQAVVDPAAVGLPVLVFLLVRPGPTTDVKQLVDRWCVSDGVQECHAVTGESGYLLKLRLQSLDDLGPHLTVARKFGCSVSANAVISTALERWTVPVT